MIKYACLTFSNVNKFFVDHIFSSLHDCRVGVKEIMKRGEKMMICFMSISSLTYSEHFHFLRV